MTGERVRTGDRNRRATIYPYSPTNDSGYATHAYGTARGTHWCKFEETMGGESTTAGQADHARNATLNFRDAVTVEDNDLIVIDSVQWRVAGIVHDRERRAKLVSVFRSSDMPTATTG